MEMGTDWRFTALAESYTAPGDTDRLMKEAIENLDKLPLHFEEPFIYRRGGRGWSGKCGARKIWSCNLRKGHFRECDCICKQLSDVAARRRSSRMG